MSYCRWMKTKGYINLIMIIILLIFFLCGCSYKNSNVKSYENNKLVEDSGISEIKNKQEVIKDDSLEILTTYYNKEYGYSFDIPKGWDGKYEVYETGNKTSFFYIGCPGKKIELFSIVVWDKEKYNKLKENDPYYTDVHILGTKDNLVFEEILPLDVNFNEIETEKYGEEYRLMTISMQDIHKRFHLD